MENLHGSICISDCKDLIKKANNGKFYLNIVVGESRNPVTFGDGENARTYTHYVKASVKKEERDEKRNYYIGNLRPYETRAAIPSFDEIENAPAADENDLPF